MKKYLLFSAIAAAAAVFANAGALDEAALSGSANLTADSNPVPQPLPPPDQAADLAPFLNYLDNFFTSPKALEESAGAMYNKSAPLYSINLKAIKNQYLKPELGFKTGKGTFVHISGTKAANCPGGGNKCKDKEKFFLVLTTSKGKSYFARMMDIVNASIFMHGSKDFVIDDEKFTVKVLAKLTSPENSIIEVKRGKTEMFRSSLPRMGEALAKKGLDISLSRKYKLAYGNEIVQVKEGTRFTDNMLVLLIPFPVSGADYFLLNASEMARPAGVSYPGIEAGYIFKVAGGILEISSK